MKKVFVGLFVMSAAICLTSCKNEAKSDANAPKEGEKTEANATEAAPEAEKTVDMAAVIEKAKAEGAKWGETEWKAAFKDALTAIKPMLLETADMQKKMEEAMTKGDQDAVAKIMTDLEKIGEKYKDVQKQCDEFDQICEGNEIAKKLNKDEAFKDEVLKELGLDGLDL